MRSWSFFDSSTDSTGKNLDVIGISRDIISGNEVWEKVAIVLDRTYLESKKENGLNIRIDGQRGKMIVKVPSLYIIQFLEKYDQYSRQVKSK